MEKIKQRALLIGLAILLPAVVAAVAYWQMRGLPDRVFYEEQLPLLEAAIYLGGRYPDVPPAVQRVIDERRTEVQAIIDTIPRRQLTDDYNRVKQYWILRYVPPTSTAALCLALVALSIGAGGMLFLSAAARRSMISRDELYRWFRRGLKLLPFILSGVSLPLILALIGVSVSLLMRGYASGTSVSRLELAVGALIFVLVIAGGMLAMRIGSLFRKMFTLEPNRVEGTPLTPETAPKVWEMAAEVARKANLPMPENIVMGFDSGFYVTNGIVRGQRGEAPCATLYLYLPLMLVMEEDELRSVVAHELGHLRSEDLEYREKFGAAYLAAYETVRHLVTEGSDDEVSQLVLMPAEKLALFFLNSFQAADRYWSRERETAADGIAAKVAGNDASALALVRTALFMPHIEAFIEKFRLRGGEGNPLAALKLHLETASVATLASVMEEEQSHPFDTHPCLRERLAFFDREGDASLEARAAAIKLGELLVELGL